jgi:hypothetical protein
MKRTLIIALACALAPLASAQLYKYVDKDGKTVYSDQPPANVETKQVHVAPSAPPPAAAQKSSVARDKDAEKVREATREKAKKVEQMAKADEATQARCAQGRRDLQLFTEGGRIGRLNEKGERVFFSDAEIETERARAQRTVDEACKK